MQPSLQEFYDSLLESGVVPSEDLRRIRERNQPDGALDLARDLINDRVLTRYQAMIAFNGDVNELILGRDGRYIILEELGKGAAGEVYKARHEILDRVVAAKVLKQTAEPYWQDRFRREIRLAAKMQHPNIVPIYDAREHNNTPFLVMALIDGVDLETHIRNSGMLNINQTVEIVRQVCKGLAYAHDRDIIHRDIKPSNLMLSREDGRVTILDFGLAKFREEVDSDGGLTATGVGMGTADYMAPEQGTNAKAVDRRADIYSLGCSLFHLLAGRPMFKEEESYLDKLIAHRHARIPSITQYRQDVPAELARCYRKMVAKEPDQRYRHVGEVLEQLNSLPGLPSPPVELHEDRTGQRSTNSLEIEFVEIEVGVFNMGSDADESDRVSDAGYPKHVVQLTQPFAIASHPITQRTYQLLMETNPSQHVGRDCPVENVSWIDAVYFANALSIHESLEEYYEIADGDVTVRGGLGYRLPTEAEWEFACRAGSESPWHFGGNEDQLESFAWTSENSDGHPHPVGDRIPNRWGLHDMYGNVWEWCWDYYDELYYQYSEEVDPTGPVHGSSRVIRGGSFVHRRNCRSSARAGIAPEGNGNVGCRLARSLASIGAAQ